MAKWRPMVLAPRRRKDRQPVRIDKNAATKSERDEDAWAQAGVPVCPASVATPACSHLAQAPIKLDEAEDDIALETPIVQGQWKVIAPDGREEVTYKPIPGFEHLWNGAEQAQGLPSTVSSSPPASLPACQSPTAQAPALCKAPQRTRKRKRTRAIVQDSSEDDNEEQHGSRDVDISSDPAHQFHIGDLEQLKLFFRRRLDELTTKPVRPIVTAWLRLREPKRKHIYGSYNKILPRDQSPGSVPPWWPDGIPYQEPSHLDKKCLLELAVDLLLQHRDIDADKRKRSWVAELWHKAKCVVEMTPSDQFSSSKDSDFSKTMQQRALNEILPSLFEIAQKHEDHVRQSQHGMGGEVSWQPLTRPPRQALAPRKRQQTAMATTVVRIKSDVDASADETEVDDTTVPSCPRYERDTRIFCNSNSPAPRQDASAPVPAREPTQLDSLAYSSTATPSTSFGQSNHVLPLGDDMDLDVNGASSAPYHGQVQLPSTLASNPLQYSSTHHDYNNHDVQLHQNGSSFPSMQSAFIPVSPPLYEHSLHFFNTPYPLEYSDNYSFTPAHSNCSFFHGLPLDASISGHQQTPYH